MNLGYSQTVEIKLDNYPVCPPPPPLEGTALQHHITPFINTEMFQAYTKEQQISRLLTH